MEISINYPTLFDNIDLQRDERKVIDEFQTSITTTTDFIILLKTELSQIQISFKENPSEVYQIICQKKEELCDRIKKMDEFYRAIVELNGALMVAHQKGGLLLDELTNERNNLKIELEIFEKRLKKDQDELQQLKTLSITQETEVETAKSGLEKFTEKIKVGLALGYMAVLVGLHIASPESTQAIPPDSYKQIDELCVSKMTKEKREEIIQMHHRHETLLEIIEKEKENVIILKHRNYQISQELGKAEKRHLHQKAKLAAFAVLIKIGCNFHSTLIKLQSPLDDILNIYETNIETNNIRFKERQEKKFEEEIFKSLQNASNIYCQFNFEILINSAV